MSEMGEYYDNHYAEMMVQPIEVMQSILSPEGFNGYLFGNAGKYHLRAGHKANESVKKEESKRDRYISWLYHATRGEIINPRLEYDCPLWYREEVILQIERKSSEIARARLYGENN